MKTIQVGEKKVTLDIWEELRVKDLRKIAPILTRQKEGEEIQMILDIVEALWGKEQAEIVDEMNIEEYREFSQEVTKLLDTQKKIVKS